MLDMIKKTDNEYVCVVDDNALYQMIGKNKMEVTSNSDVLVRVVSELMKMLINKYDIDEDQYNIHVQLYDPQNSPNFMMVVNTYPLNGAETEEDEYYESEEATIDAEPERHQWETLPALHNIMFATNNIEHIIAAQQQYHVFDHCQHTLFHFKGKYIICFHDLDQNTPEIQHDLKSMLTEYTVMIHDVTYAYLSEYAKVITDDIPSMVDVLVG